MARLVCNLVLLLMCASASANTFYVKDADEQTGGTTDGSSCANAYDGLADLQASAAGAGITGGDTIYLVGTFAGESLDIGRTGSSGSPITISGLGGVCAGYPNNASLSNTGGSVIFTVNDQYVNYEYMTLGGVQSGSDSTSNFLVGVGANGNVLQNLTFQGNGNNYIGILGNLNASATNVIGLKILDSTFDDLTQDAIRLIGRNSASACSGSEGEFISAELGDLTFDTVKTAIRTQGIDPTCTEIASGYGWHFHDITVSNTTQNAVNISWEAHSGYDNIFEDFVFINIGSTTIVNALQTGMLRGGYIQDGVINGVTTTTPDGDGNGIIIDHASTNASYPSDDVTIRRVRVTGADSNSESCGIMIWNGTDTNIYSSILDANSNGLCIANSRVTGTRAWNLTLKDNVEDQVEYSITAPASELYNSTMIGGQYAVRVESGSAPTEKNNAMYGASVDLDGGFTKDAGTVTADPLVGADFIPQTGSPLWGAGRHIYPCEDYRGGACLGVYDIGAYQDQYVPYGYTPKPKKRRN